MRALRDATLALLMLTLAPSALLGQDSAQEGPAADAPGDDAAVEDDDWFYWGRTSYSFNARHNGGGGNFHRLSLAAGYGAWAWGEHQSHGSVFAGASFEGTAGDEEGSQEKGFSGGLLFGMSWVTELLGGKLNFTGRDEIGPVRGSFLWCLAVELGGAAATTIDLGAPIGHPLSTIQDASGTRAAIRGEWGLLVASVETCHVWTKFNQATLRDSYWGLKLARPWFAVGVLIGHRRQSSGSYHRNSLVFGVEVVF